MAEGRSNAGIARQLFVTEGTAQNWPPVTGPATAPGVTGTFGTIKRSDGSVQATFDGHPLYAFVGDTAPGQAKGNVVQTDGQWQAEFRFTGE